MAWRILHTVAWLAMLNGCAVSVPAQPPAGPAAETLVAVIVVARHGVRAPIESEIRSGRYNAQPWPVWPVKAGALTPHGALALEQIGGFWRRQYGSLLANPCHAIYAEANTTQRTLASAQAVLRGLAPECSVAVTVGPPGQLNPLFSPAVGSPSAAELIQATEGRVGGHPEWFTQVFAEPLQLLSDVLHTCPDGSACHTPRADLLAPQRNLAGASTDLTETPPAIGADLAEHFLLEYTEGMPMSSVGWGLVDQHRLRTLMDMNTRFHDFMLRTPLYAQAGASDLAERIGLTLAARAAGHPLPGSLGTAAQSFLLLDGHDSNLTWLGGLLHMDWALEDETLNATPPGSALIFELVRRNSTRAVVVRVRFEAQTLAQIRSATSLAGNAPPMSAPIFIPGCSTGADDACPLPQFLKIIRQAEDRRFLEPGLRRR